MSPLLQKLAGWAAIVVVLAMEGVLGLTSFIGLTTLPEDVQKLPRLVQWLLGTPWWVPSLVIPLGLLAFAAWVFKPDAATLNAMKEYKKSNDRAWAFQPIFQAQIDKWDSQYKELSHSHQELIKKLEYIEQSLCLIEEKTKERILEEISSSSLSVIRDITGNVKDEIIQQLQSDFDEFWNGARFRLEYLEKSLRNRDDD